MKMPKEGTVQELVLNYLLTGHSLDLPKAIAMWGHVRLSDAIHKLRKKGHNIITDTIEVPGGDISFAVYRLSKEPTKDTPTGTRVRITEEYPDKGNVGLEGTLLPRRTSEFPFTAEIEGSCFPWHFFASELEVVYASR